MATYYHGSPKLFERFDLSHALEGDGKVKFGYGIYLTSEYRSAAHYSGCGAGKDALVHYVYTVEVPELAAGNYIKYKENVHPSIIKRTEDKLGRDVPEKVCTDGKDFRKWVALTLTGEKKITPENEKAAAEWLDSIGVIFSIWPYSWTKADSPLNRAVFNDQNIRIVKIETIELDERGEFIPGSNKEIKR